MAFLKKIRSRENGEEITGWRINFHQQTKNSGRQSIIELVRYFQIYKHSSNVRRLFWIDYVDDIVIVSDAYEGIDQLKQHLDKRFGKLKYFLGN